MKHLFLATALTVALAACGPKQDPQQQGDNAAGVGQTPTEAVAASPPPRVEKGIDVLTGMGFQPDFANAVVYDIVDKDKKGVNRHRVLLEVLEGDVVAAMDNAEASLASVGYEKAKETESDGRYDTVFTKKGAPTLVFMAQTAERGPALKNPGAVGTIHIMWNFY